MICTHDRAVCQLNGLWATLWPTDQTVALDVPNADDHVDVWHLLTYLCQLYGWLGIRVVSVLDSGAVRPGFKLQLRRYRVTVQNATLGNRVWATFTFLWSTCDSMVHWPGGAKLLTYLFTSTLWSTLRFCDSMVHWPGYDSWHLRYRWPHWCVAPMPWTLSATSRA